MSISSNGVQFTKKHKRNLIVMGMLVVVQAVLSLLLYISFAANIVWPEKSHAAVGVANVLAYEGLLTDSSGNLLGGSGGSSYCFRFSIYDSASGGTKLWPSGTPATTMATSTNGVFSALIGSADTLTYDFYDSDTVYLNVDVNTTTSTCGGSWESLTPRQRIAATGYSIAAQNVYGNLLRTNISSSIVQTGTGSGSPSPIYLGLDIKNTADYVGQSCSTNGLMWYNSVTTQALICTAGLIQKLGSVGTTTIAALNANAGTPVSAGTVVFSNSNGVSFGINASTITASVAAGAAIQTVSRTMWPLAAMTALTSVPQGSMSIQYFPIGNQLTATRFDVVMSLSLGTSATAATAAMVLSQWVGIYSKNGATLMSLSTASNQQTVSWASNSGSYSSLTGMRLFSIPFNVNATPGDYYLAYNISTNSSSIGTATTALAPIMSIYGAAIGTVGGPASDWGITATSSNVFGGMGVYSAQINSNLGNLSLSAILQTGVNISKANYWLQLRNI